MPSKLNAEPTSPGANVAPLSSVPLLVPTMSLASPSPGHQAASPGGGEMQSADHARNVAGRKARPAIAHHQALMKRRGELTDLAGWDVPMERTDETILIVTFR